MPRLLAALVYEFASWVCAVFVIFLFSARYVGGGNVPRRGAALLIANHESFIDPILVGVGAGRHLTFLARKTLFKTPFKRALLETVNCVPIDQEGVGKEGIRNIIKKLEAGHAVLVFPEGERSWDGKFHALRPGIALLLERAGVPIVPIGVAGPFEAWSRFKAFPTPSPIFLAPTNRTMAVAYGPARDPATLKAMTRAQMLETLHADIAAQIRRAEALQRK
jgi:1-acyl-sn-glycerol-3-phosphate acyltransferase